MCIVSFIVGVIWCCELHHYISIARCSTGWREGIHNYSAGMPAVTALADYTNQTNRTVLIHPNKHVGKFVFTDKIINRVDLLSQSFLTYSEIY